MKNHQKGFVGIALLIILLALSFSFVSAQSYTFGTNLTIGSSGNDVSNLQTILINKGFNIPAIRSGVSSKGYFGSQTKAAVIKYQISVGLPNTGFVGPLTRGKLNGNDNSNQSLIINGIDGPLTLNYNQTGTWTVRTSDPTNSQLSYAVDWGDIGITTNCDPIPVGYSGGPCPQPGSNATQSAFVQSATFTHAYLSPGTYTVKFTVRNSSGNQVQSSITVLVSNLEGSAVTVLTPNGGENWNINSTQAIKWKMGDAFNSNSKVDIYLGRQFFPPNPSCGNLHPCGPFFETSTYVLDKNISNTGVYNWIVGTDINNNPIPRGSYGVRICLATTDNCDFSDGPFTLIDQAYENNLPPVITSISGPTSVSVGQTATYTVNAYDPEGGTLSYWAHGTSDSVHVVTSGNVMTATFFSAGTFQIGALVQDNVRKEANSDITVNVR